MVELSTSDGEGKTVQEADILCIQVRQEVAIRTAKEVVVTYLCLPNDPDNGKPYAYANNVLYGAEYQTSGSSKPSGLDNLHDKDVPCAVCRRRGKSSVLMIPGKHTCYSGWKTEYTGFPMTENKVHNNKDYVC